MEYIYAAMLLHKANKPIDDASVKKVLEAAGIKPDDARIKALVAALDGVDIESAIKEAVVSAPAAAPAAGGTGESESKPEKKEEKPEQDEKKDQEQAAAGLGALFG